METKSREYGNKKQRIMKQEVKNMETEVKWQKLERPNYAYYSGLPSRGVATPRSKVNYVVEISSVM